MAGLLRRAVLGLEGGGPFGQLAELAAQLLQFPDAPIEVGGVALQQVADMAQGA